MVPAIGEEIIRDSAVDDVEWLDALRPDVRPNLVVVEQKMISVVRLHAVPLIGRASNTIVDVAAPDGHIAETVGCSQFNPGGSVAPPGVVSRGNVANLEGIKGHPLYPI